MPSLLQQTTTINKSFPAGKKFPGSRKGSTPPQHTPCVFWVNSARIQPVPRARFWWQLRASIFPLKSKCKACRNPWLCLPHALPVPRGCAEPLWGCQNIFCWPSCGWYTVCEPQPRSWQMEQQNTQILLFPRLSMGCIVVVRRLVAKNWITSWWFHFIQ